MYIEPLELFVIIVSSAIIGIAMWNLSLNKNKSVEESEESDSDSDYEWDIGAYSNAWWEREKDDKTH